MTSAAPEILVRRGLDRGLIWTILGSGLLHALAVLVLVALPRQMLRPVPKLESYTVDLVAPGSIGGTNLIPGSGGRKPAEKSKPAPAAAAMPPASAPVPPAVKPAEPARPVEPPKPAVAPPPAVPKPPPPVQAAKPIDPPKAVEPPKPPAEPKPAPKPVAVAKPPEVEKAVAVVPPKPEAKPKPETKPPAKAVEAKPAAPPEAKSAAPAKPAAAKAEKPATDKPAKAAPAEDPAAQRDQQIAAAVQRRASNAQAETASKDLDKQIAAAVQRRAAEAGEGVGSGAQGTGGPVSYGPGEGPGGTTKGLEYILYHGRMVERIKAAWAWAGANKALRSVVQFKVSPDGQITHVRTIESSGDGQYDASAERAVRAVNPLEPVPATYLADFATVEIVFLPSDLES
ncbi:MAG: energy transducer TonB [Candidatus Binatia bacterium]